MSYLMGDKNEKSMKRSIYNKMFGGKSNPAPTEQAKKENFNSQFRFVLSSETKAKLELLSKASGKSQGAILREGIEAFASARIGKKEIVIAGKIFTPAKSLRARKIK